MYIFILTGLAQGLSLNGWSSGLSAGLQCVSLGAFFYYLIKQNSIKSVMIGAWLFSLTWLLISIHWIQISLTQYGGLSNFAGWSALFFLCASLAIYHMLAMALVYWLTDKKSLWLRCLALAMAWTAAELARASWFTGFSWASGGYAHIDGILKLAVPYVGVMGILLMASLVASFLVCVQEHNGISIRVKVTIQVAVLLLITYTPQQIKLGQSDLVQTVTLLQANVDPLDKFIDEGKEETEWYLEQIKAANTNLVIAPETALAKITKPKDLQFKLEEYEIRGEKQKFILIGALENISNGYANAAWGLMNGKLQIYHKRHLLPFGEYTPAWFSWFAQWLNIPYSNFTSSAETVNSFVNGLHVYAVSICYENLFGNEMAPIFLQSQTPPTAMINISNLAWFGNGIALDQHLAIGRMRALEFRRPMLMATNSGWSAVIDDTGTVLARSQKAQRNRLVTSYQGVRAAPTFYAEWAGRWGHLPLWLICIASFGLISCVRRNQNLEASSSEAACESNPKMRS